MFRHLLLLPILLTCLLIESASAQSDFRIAPYLQRPDFDGITILWFSESNAPGTATVSDESGVVASMVSEPEQMTELAYPIWEINTNSDDFPNGNAPPPPYRHRVRFEGLEWSKEYNYEVVQKGESFVSRFRTPSGILDPIRFAVYGDSETEPESDGAKVSWSDPTGAATNRTYLIDQTVGYDNNLDVLRGRDLDFVAIAGDLVQSGGEQRDWDRFWHHNTNLDPDSSLAGSVPLFPVPGNHEYYASPHRSQNEAEAKEYRQPFSEQALARYGAYFEVPSNGTGDAREGRYYRVDYGPITLIALDVCNNGANQTADDTNFKLLGEDDAAGGPAPSFGPGSEQYEWLETQLASAQEDSPFTFVLMHYAAYSVGPHGLPAGDGEGQDPLSGVPVRGLTSLFQQYGVDAVFAGHDEMWERSVVEGTEMLPGGGERDHSIQFYDVGIGGDGLRGSVDGLANPFQAFLAHTDSPEVWEGARLVDGGKHYGHLEVTVDRTGPHSWSAELTPVYVFPLFDAAGTQYLGYERRVYDDVITLTSDDELRTLGSHDAIPTESALALSTPYPNPTTGSVSLSLSLPESSQIAITAYDVLGRAVRTIDLGLKLAGAHEIQWDGRDNMGATVPNGLYVLVASGSSGVATQVVTMLRDIR